MAFRSQMSRLSVQTKLDSFFKPALLRSKTSTTSESPVGEQKFYLFVFLNKGSIYITKFSIYLCSKFFFFCLLGLPLVSLI
jgi:hypothetical protein